jgi:DNA-binding response OmpR family regulator
MRKGRVIIYEADSLILSALTEHFRFRGLDVQAYQTPVICPLDSSTDCVNIPACADLVIADYSLPTMSGFELLIAQSRKGCKVPIQNKALLAGFMDGITLRKLHELGYAYFEKPFTLEKIDAWLDRRMPQMDLSQPLGIIRREKRDSINMEVSYIHSQNNENLRGLAVNMSPSGLCIRINTPLEYKQQIAVLTSGTDSLRSAVVRWVWKTENGFYLAGLHFA